MITSKKQAIAVQDRRFKSGKLGIAKAVRRFMKREFKIGNDGFGLKRQLQYTMPVAEQEA